MQRIVKRTQQWSGRQKAAEFIVRIAMLANKAKAEAEQRQKQQHPSRGRHPS